MITLNIKKTFEKWILDNSKMIWRAIDSQKEIWVDMDEIVFSLGGDSEFIWSHNGIDFEVEVSSTKIDEEYEFCLHLSANYNFPFHIRR